MDPYISGLVVGFILGGIGGICALALVSHGRPSEDEDDAARFRALQAYASLVSDDESDQPESLANLADKIRATRREVEIS